MKHEINWTHWQQRRGVKVWEACLLSVDVDPAAIAKEEERSFYKLSSLSQHIFDTTFGSPGNQAEYYRRLCLVSGYLDDADSFNPISTTESNKHLWEIKLSEFCVLAKRIKLLPLPAEMSSTFAPSPEPRSNSSSSTSSPTDSAIDHSIIESRQPLTDWKKLAGEIALKVQKEKPKFTHDQISEAVRAEMEKMHEAGHQGATGRSGKLPSATSIRRHALSGLRVNKKLAGMSRQAVKVLNIS